MKRSKDHSITLPLDAFQKQPVGLRSVNEMMKGGSKGKQDGKLTCSLLVDSVLVTVLSCGTANFNSTSSRTLLGKIFFKLC